MSDDTNKQTDATRKKPPMPKDFDATAPDPQDVAGIEWTVRDQMRRAERPPVKITR